jgi:hypothetical protein
VPEPEVEMKKLLVAAIAAVGGLVAYRKVQGDRAEADLWAEATDRVR